jgi:hypothetical protein
VKEKEEMRTERKGKVVPVLNEFKHYAMKAYWEVDA